MSSSTIRRARKLADESNPFCKRRLAQLQGLNTDVAIPSHFLCPISLDLMRDPVTVSTGITYDRPSIETWLATGNSACPVTNQALATDETIIPNHSIRRMIQDWCVANRSYGVERIPTPKTPVTPVQASELLSDIVSASRFGDGGARCRELINKMKALADESERNRRCIASAGAGSVLASLFSSFATRSPVKVSEEMLAVLTTFSPLDDEACRYVAFPESLNIIAAIAKRSSDIAARTTAVSVIKEVVASNKELANMVARTEGLIQTLVELIKEPISPQATKASLLASFYLISSGSETTVIMRFVEMGLVPLLIEMLVNSEKSTSEKVLAVFDAVCSHDAARNVARDHALTVPVLVKKMFRVSDAAAELVISALWKLCKDCKSGEQEGCLLVEALQVGAFQKLLLLLQVGCGGKTKEKATELLKMLNGFKGRLDCIDNLDFKGLKRSF